MMIAKYETDNEPKPEFTTETITEIISAANSTDEIAAGAYR